MTCGQIDVRQANRLTRVGVDHGAGAISIGLDGDLIEDCVVALTTCEPARHAASNKCIAAAELTERAGGGVLYSAACDAATGIT